MNKWILALTCIVIATISWLLMLVIRPSESTSAKPGEIVESTNMQGSKQLLPVSSSPEQRDAVAVEQAPDFDSSLNGSQVARSSEERVPTPDSYFETKYPRLKRESANAYAKEVDGEFRALKARLFSDRNAAGLFEVYPYEYDDNGRVKPFGMVMPGLTFAKPFDSPERREWHVVFLHEGDCPELFRLWDERAWLRKKAATLPE